MVLRNVALLITNDNRQGIMETIIVLLALLSQILGLFGFVFSCLLFLRFGKVKGWFNKKAGTEIVSSFSFRSLRTLICNRGAGVCNDDGGSALQRGAFYR